MKEKSKYFKMNWFTTRFIFQVIYLFNTIFQCLHFHQENYNIPDERVDTRNTFRN